MDLYRYYIHNKSINLKCDLKQFAKELNSSKSQRQSYNLDREEIRRKLAMVSSSSSSSSSNDPTITVQLNQNTGLDEHHLHHNHVIMPDYLRPSHRSNKSHYMGQNLQICFMNESINDDSTENESGLIGDDYRLEHFNEKIHSNSHGSMDSDLNGEYDNEDADDDNDGQQFDSNLSSNVHTSKNFVNKSNEANSNDHLSTTFPTFSFSNSSKTNSCEDVLLKLQGEAKQALAQVRLEVKQKLDAERNINKKPSPIADIVGLPTYGLVRLERDQIVDMNIGQLQVIVNDLCNQIEKINEELKRMLIERDDLFMQQDAILVDVEDFTKRIEELSEKQRSNELNLAKASTTPKANEHSSTQSSTNSFDSFHSLPQPSQPSPLSTKSFTTAQSLTNKVSAFFSHYSNHDNHNSSSDFKYPAPSIVTANTVASSNTNSPKSKLFSSFTNKLYRFKK